MTSKPAHSPQAPRAKGPIKFKDSTMREGLDVPGVELSLAQKKQLIHKLAEAQVDEIELVAPGHFRRDLVSAAKLGTTGRIVKSGLVFATAPDLRNDLSEASGVLHRIDLLMPLSEKRPPTERSEKSLVLARALDEAAARFERFGAGFPHATQVDSAFLLQLCRLAAEAGAERVTLYDTNGSAHPEDARRLVERVRGACDLEICFHAHNDLGLATANSLAAAGAGASCLDVTVNGLGDRAGNASLEQVALALHTRHFDHRIRMRTLPALSSLAARLTGVAVSPLAPVVGKFVFAHRSPAHLEHPGLFEAFPPALVGGKRRLVRR